MATRYLLKMPSRSFWVHYVVAAVFGVAAGAWTVDYLHHRRIYDEYGYYASTIVLVHSKLEEGDVVSAKQYLEQSLRPVFIFLVDSRPHWRRRMGVDAQIYDRNLLRMHEILSTDSPSTQSVFRKSTNSFEISIDSELHNALKTVETIANADKTSSDSP